MSNGTGARRRLVDAPAAGASVGTRIAGRLRDGGEAAAFWTGVALPVGYPAIALPDVQVGPPVVAVLLAVHAVALLAGHDYRR